MNRNKGVIVLAAGTLKHKLPFIKVAVDCPSFVPLGQKSSIVHIASFYAPEVTKILVMVNSGDEDQVRQELIQFRGICEVVGVRTANVVDTLRAALHHVEGSTTSDWTVNLVTTIPTRLPESSEVFLATGYESSNEWSSVLVEESGNRYFVKCREHTGLARVFTGVFRTSLDSLTKSVQACTGQDLIEVVEVLDGSQALKFTEVPWIDVGHEVNYARAKASLSAARSFNSLLIDTEFGAITKSSDNWQKLKNEHEYVRKLPEDVSVLFPRLLGLGTGDSNRFTMAMEYYGYPTLAELMLFWSLDETAWRTCFRTLRRVLTTFRRHPAVFSKDEYREFFIQKLRGRIAEFLSSPTLDEHVLTAEFINVNGVRLLNCPNVIETIEPALMKGFEPNDFCLMHGDLCFSNVLYDPHSGVIRLIDARGSFGTPPGIFGDQKYDLAKLVHSTVGQYDYFIAGLFSVAKVGAGSYRLQISRRANYALLKGLTTELIAEMGYDFNFIFLITGTLFLSMTPLHSDSPERQLALYLHGLQLVNSALGVCDYESLY